MIYIYIAGRRASEEDWDIAAVPANLPALHCVASFRIFTANTAANRLLSQGAGMMPHSGRMTNWPFIPILLD